MSLDTMALAGNEKRLAVMSVASKQAYGLGHFTFWSDSYFCILIPNNEPNLLHTVNMLPYRLMS